MSHSSFQLHGSYALSVCTQQHPSAAPSRPSSALRGYAGSGGYSSRRWSCPARVCARTRQSWQHGGHAGRRGQRACRRHQSAVRDARARGKEAAQEDEKGCHQGASSVARSRGSAGGEEAGGAEKAASTRCRPAHSTHPRGSGPGREHSGNAVDLGAGCPTTSKSTQERRCRLACPWQRRSRRTRKGGRKAAIEARGNLSDGKVLPPLAWALSAGGVTAT